MQQAAFTIGMRSTHLRAQIISFCAAFVGVLFSAAGLAVNLTAANGRPSGSMAVAGYALLIVMAATLLAIPAIGLPLFAAERQHLRHPPVFTPEGVRLRMFAKTGYDTRLPWGEVSRVWIGTRLREPYLLIAVRDAEALAGQDPSRSRRLRRTGARFPGAVFAYGLRRRRMDLAEIEDAVRRSSGGRMDLG